MPTQKIVHLPKGPLPVAGSWVLVQGAEEQTKRALVERLRGQLLAEDDAFNLDQVDVGDRWDGVAESLEQAKRDRLPTRADRILVMAQALPFLGAGRLVIVRGVDALPTDQQKLLAGALATVPPSNHVVLVTEGGEGGKAAKVAADLAKGIEKVGTVFECSPLTEEDAGAVVKALLLEWNQTIEPAATRMLITRAGTELRRLQVETEKLSLLVGEGGRVCVAHVEELTAQRAEESVFHLADAVAARDSAKAMAILRDLMEGQLEPAFRLFPLLVRQFRLIWQTKVLLDAGWRPRQGAEGFPKALAILPEQNATGQICGWMGSKLAVPARQMSWDQLSRAYQLLLEADMAGKGIDGVPRMEMELAIELLVAKLCVVQ
jgi:DNA polymerase III delta subunit